MKNLLAITISLCSLSPAYAQHTSSQHYLELRSAFSSSPAMGKIPAPGEFKDYLYCRGSSAEDPGNALSSKKQQFDFQAWAGGAVSVRRVISFGSLRLANGDFTSVDLWSGSNPPQNPPLPFANDEDLDSVSYRKSADGQSIYIESAFNNSADPKRTFITPTRLIHLDLKDPIYKPSIVFPNTKAVAYYECSMKPKTCGLVGDIDARIKDCDASIYEYAGAAFNHPDTAKPIITWKLVSTLENGTQLWQDARTHLVWSDMPMSKKFDNYSAIDLLSQKPCSDSSLFPGRPGANSAWRLPTFKEITGFDENEALSVERVFLGSFATGRQFSGELTSTVQVEDGVKSAKTSTGFFASDYPTEFFGFRCVLP